MVSSAREETCADIRKRDDGWERGVDSQNRAEQLCYVELMGPLRVTCAGQTVTQFATQKAAALLAWLALHPGPQPRERLMELLWPERDLLAGRNNLSTALASLRRQLEPPGMRRGSVLTATHAHIGLNPEILTTDVALFENLLKQAARSDTPAKRIELLSRAVALYRDEILPGSYQDWAIRETERIQSRLQGALQQLAQDQEVSGELQNALATVQRSVALDPYSEETHCHLMRLYVLTGRIGSAREAHQRFERLLDKEFGAAPGAETQQRVADLLAQRPPPYSTPTLPSTPLPALSPSEPSEGDTPRATAPPPSTLPQVLSRFFGREAELARLAHLLLSFKERPIGPELPEPPCRLVTLIGPGGIGKTRLAIEFARQTAARFSSWCGFVSLAELTDPGQMEPQLAAALPLPAHSGTTPLETVVAFLNQQDRTSAPPLLILDNLEHLLPGAEEEGEAGENLIPSLIQALLERVPGLRVLCTSRRRLGVRGEHLLPVNPLPVPADLPVESARKDLPALLANPSVRLYVERAKSLRPDFGLTPTNAPAVAALCRQLEGSPLGIELAAAWVRVLPPRKMWERLTQGMDIPAGSYADLPARHRTLTAALDWSFRLLTQPQQRLFACLSVFRGGWTLEAAEAVCAGSGQEDEKEHWEEQNILSLLAELQEASLIATTEQADGQVRYRFLETVRAFSAQQQKALLESEKLPRRHAAYFLELAEEAARHQRSAEEAEWLTYLETEHENLRAALDWYLAEAGEIGEGLRLVVALSRFWHTHGYLREGWSYMRRVLAHGKVSLPSGLYASLLNGAAVCLWRLGDVGQAQAFYEQCLEIRRALQDRAGTANVLHNLGFLALRQGDMERARPFYEESLAIQRELQDTLGIADELHHLGMVAHGQGDLEQARRLYEESLALRRPLGDSRGIRFNLQCLANLACEQGNYAQAQRLYEEDLAERQALGDRQGMAETCCNLGNIFRLRGDWKQAWTFSRKSLALQQELGDWYGIAEALDLLATLSLDTNHLFQAASLYSAVEALRTEAKATRAPADQQAYAQRIESLRERLPAAEFAAAWSGSPALSWEQRITGLISETAD